MDDAHCFTGFDGYKHVIEASDVVLIANAAKFHPLPRHGRHPAPASMCLWRSRTALIRSASSSCSRRATWPRRRSSASCPASRAVTTPGYIETVQRIHDGAIGDVVSIEENFLRAPYRVTERKPDYSELDWQCSTQYHFRWLSGDDVPQSLVHNLDRSSWVLGNVVPIKCHGLGRPLHDGGAALRGCVRSSLGGVRVRQGRAGLRLLPHHHGLLRREFEPDLGQQRQGVHH